jgi:hypothetical protein
MHPLHASPRTRIGEHADGEDQRKPVTLTQSIPIMDADERVTLASPLYPGSFKFFCTGISELDRESISARHGSFTSFERAALRDDPRWVALYGALG